MAGPKRSEGWSASEASTGTSEASGYWGFFLLGANSRCPLSGSFFYWGQTRVVPCRGFFLTGGKLALSLVGVFFSRASYGGFFYGGFFSRNPGGTFNVLGVLLCKNLFTIHPVLFRTISVISYSPPINNGTVFYCAKPRVGHYRSGDCFHSTNFHFPPPLTPPRRI